MKSRLKLLSAVATAALMTSATVAVAQTAPAKEPQAQERQDKDKGAANSGSAQQDRAPRNVGPTQAPTTSAQSSEAGKAKSETQTRSQEPAGKDRATTAPGKDASDQAKDEGRGQKTDTAKKDVQDSQRDAGKKADSDKDGAKQARDRDQDRSKQDRARSDDAKRDRDQDRARSDDGKRDRDAADRPGDDRQARDRDDRRGDRDSVSLSDREETRIRETISRQNVRRVTNVNFNISVGVVVPRTVELYPLPAVIVEIVPQYRGYRYIVVRDEIVIVHPETHRIVTVIPAEGRTQARSGPRSGGRVEFSSAQRDRIRTYALQECRTVVAAPTFDLTVGARIPTSYELCPFEDVFVRDVQVVQPYRYLIVQDEVVLVDPSTHTIVEVIR